MGILRLFRTKKKRDIFAERRAHLMAHGRITDGKIICPCHNSEFNLDLGYSSSEEQTREWVAPILEALPPIADRNANESGTDLVGYLTQSQGFSSFLLDNGAVYHTYSTGARGVEFLMGYYGILDRTPKGRDEGDAFQVWIRRHDEYDSE